MKQLPPVSIIVLNWNAGYLLDRCLSALMELNYPEYTIILVDNSSTDGSLQLVRERFSGVRIIGNDRNLGYSAGNNVALQEVDHSLIAILNPDVFVAQDWLISQVKAMEADNMIGITGSKLYYPGEKLIQHAGGYLSFPRAITGHYGLLEEDHGQCNMMRDVDYVIGAAFLIRRSVIDQIGMFDEGYFMYFEDVDLCYRARRGGLRVVYVPEAIGIHVESATSKKGSAAYFRRFHTSRWRFLLKNNDLDEVLAETVPAEREWISLIGSMERRAVYFAFRSIIKSLPAIKSRRTLDGGSLIEPMTNAQELAITSSLAALKQDARKEGLYSLAEISGAVRERWRKGRSSFPDETP
jgi:GT2 family glycosyltransferase